MVKPEVVMLPGVANILRGSEVSQVQNTFGLPLKDCEKTTGVLTTVFAVGDVIAVTPVIIWGTLFRH